MASTASASNMRIDALSDDGVVSHHARDRDDRHTRGEEQADRRVAAVVQADPSQSGFGRETCGGQRCTCPDERAPRSRSRRDSRFPGTPYRPQLAPRPGPCACVATPRSHRGLGVRADGSAWTSGRLRTPSRRRDRARPVNVAHLRRVVPPSRTVSDQRRPSTSPRRSPDMVGAHAPARRSSWAQVRNARDSSAVHAAISRCGRGIRSTSGATLRWSSPSRTAAFNACRSRPMVRLTVRGARPASTMLSTRSATSLLETWSSRIVPKARTAGARPTRYPSIVWERTAWRLDRSQVSTYSARVCSDLGT